MTGRPQMYAGDSLSVVPFALQTTGEHSENTPLFFCCASVTKKGSITKYGCLSQ